MGKIAGRVKKWPKEWTKTYYKGYPRFPAFKLNEPTNITNPFDQIMNNRISTRDFADRPFSYQDLSNILYYSAGENKTRKTKLINYRFYPAAGARYPFEIYPIIMNVNGLNQGIYHYYVRNNLLEMLEQKIISKSFLSNAFGRIEWPNASVFLVISSLFFRTQMKYHEAGYKMILMDLGHLCQNIYLTCSALNIGCCEINGHSNSMFNELLDLDGWRESTLIVMALGNKK